MRLGSIKSGWLCHNGAVRSSCTRHTNVSFWIGLHKSSEITLLSTTWAVQKKSSVWFHSGCRKKILGLHLLKILFPCWYWNYIKAPFCQKWLENLHVLPKLERNLLKFESNRCGNVKERQGLWPLFINISTIKWFVKVDSVLFLIFLWFSKLISIHISYFCLEYLLLEKKPDFLFLII